MTTGTGRDDEQHRDVLDPASAGHLRHEPDASRPWGFAPRVAAGWLQTDVCTLALSAGIGKSGTPPDTLTRQMAVRQARRQVPETGDMVPAGLQPDGAATRTWRGEGPNRRVFYAANPAGDEQAQNLAVELAHHRTTPAAGAGR